MFQLDSPEDDGLFIPEVGAWSAHKHHFLRRYIDAFTTAMRKKRWSGLHYVDLFAGAGIERLKDDGLDWGSPLIGAQAPHQFSRLHLCEKSTKPFNALSTRLAKYKQPQPPQLIAGDANQAVKEIVAEIPTRSLSLAFLDPYGLHLHLETVRTLSSRRTDLIIFFPDHLDALRNWEKVYAGQHDSNLDRVLGTTDWFDRLQSAAKSQWASVLLTIYKDQLRTMGYEHFDHERIGLPGGRPLYLLLFCCRDKTGGEIWRNVAAKKPGGQHTFEF